MFKGTREQHWDPYDRPAALRVMAARSQTDAKETGLRFAEICSALTYTCGDAGYFYLGSYSTFQVNSVTRRRAVYSDSIHDFFAENTNNTQLILQLVRDTQNYS